MTNKNFQYCKTQLNLANKKFQAKRYEEVDEILSQCMSFFDGDLESEMKTILLELYLLKAKTAHYTGNTKVSKYFANQYIRASKDMCIVE